MTSMTTFSENFIQVLQNELSVHIPNSYSYGVIRAFVD